jgi:ABC-2 type transport system permease protein
VLALELRRTRTQLVAYAATVALFGVAVAAVYPTIRDTAALIEPYLDMLPPGLLEAFEMGDGIAAVGAYFGSQFFQVWVILAAMFAIGVGTRGAAGETSAGTIEIPLSAPLARTRYLVTTIVNQAIGLAVLAVVAVVSVVALGPVIDVAFDLVAFAQVGLLSFAFGCAMAGVSTLASVVTLDRTRSIGFAALLLILMYLVTVVTALEPRVEGLEVLSAFTYYRPAEVIDAGRPPVGATALFLAVAAVTWALAAWRFRTRDLVA